MAAPVSTDILTPSVVLVVTPPHGLTKFPLLLTPALSLPPNVIFNSVSSILLPIQTQDSGVGVKTCWIREAKKQPADFPF